VASAVGLVSIEIFGYTNPRCKEYAVDLGLALQLTNILRDVGQDLNNGGRVYLPLEDLERFGYSLEDLAARRPNDAFLRLMQFEADRAGTFYQRAIAALPPEDRRSMLAAEIMRGVYWRVLQRMRAGDFRVFDQRYRLTGLEKLWTIVSTVVRSFVARERPRARP
jgi:phytoene synthase